MGGKVCKKNVLFIGSEGSGKTSLLYHLKLGQFIPDFDATDAFNYEIVSRPRDGFRYDLHTWDLSGREELAQLWSVFYENANVDAVVYVINANKTETLANMESDIHYLMHEESLRMSKVVIILNIFKEADAKAAYGKHRTQENMPRCWPQCRNTRRSPINFRGQMSGLATA